MAQLSITYQQNYTEYGCNFQGNLAVIDYQDYLKSLPNYGEFRAMSFCDALDQAKAAMFSVHPGAVVILDFPTLVCSL